MASPPFRKHDPLRTFQFRVSVPLTLGSEGEESGTRVIAGVQRVSGLVWTVSAAETWSGGNNLHRYANPERVTWDPVTCESGLALDDTLVLWAEAVREFVATGKKPAVAVKRTVFIDVWDGHPLDKNRIGTSDPARTMRFILKNAWISKFQALPRLDALSSEVAIQTVDFVHEGWTRVTDASQLTTVPKLPASSGSDLSVLLGPDPTTPSF